MIVVTMLEHIEAVHNLEEILATPGLTAILIGAWDLSASMGHRASLAIQKWCRPSEAIITKTRQTDVFTGIAIGHDPGPNIEWAKKGAQWLGLGAGLGDPDRRGW